MSLALINTVLLSAHSCFIAATAIVAMSHLRHARSNGEGQF